MSGQFKARLESGEVVILEKDCACVTHDGPCWIHHDDLLKRLNRPLLERALRTGYALDAIAYAQVELGRLREKRSEMEYRHIVEIIRPEEVARCIQTLRKSRRHRRP